MKELVKWLEVQSVALRWKSEPDKWLENVYADGALNRLVVTDVAESWNDFLGWSSRLNDWGFRGQREAFWTLQSSLEREIKVVHSHGNISGHRHLDREMVGNRLLRNFRGLARLHLQVLPSEDDLAGWLSLMQHYGGPTRLLDWSESAFVGMYFALRKGALIGNRSAVWAIDLKWLQRKAQETSGISALPLSVLLRRSKTPLIIRVNPQHANERIAAQKGFFLWKLYEELPFFDQMLMKMMFSPEMVQSPVIRKLEVGPELRDCFLERLFQEKNVYEDRLFPGHDFCEPLRLELHAMVERARAEDEVEMRFAQTV